MKSKKLPRHFDEKYVKNLEDRVSELEDVFIDLTNKLQRKEVDFSVYFLLYSLNEGIDDCVEHTRRFGTYDEALEYVRKYSKRKRKRKNLAGYEITENILVSEEKLGGGRFWSLDLNAKIERQGDESHSGNKVF